MKRIKNFNIFESKEQLKSIVEECQDILLELKDEGFKVNLSFGESPINWILIEVSKKEKFSANDIQFTIERIKDYLGSLGFKIYRGQSNYPLITSKSMINPMTFNLDHTISYTSLQFNLNKENIFESNGYKTIVSDVKYDLKDILIELVDDGFKYNIIINDWNRNNYNNDELEIKWLSLEVTKEGDWNLSQIEDYLIRVVEFLSLKRIYPLFAPRTERLIIKQTGLETILISNHADIFKNRMHKVSGTQNTYAYDIQFKTDDII
jgi:hypothetical protein